MKKAVLITLVFTLLIGCVNITASAVSITDISGHWAQTYIQKMVDLGIMDTRSGTQFSPNATFLRKEAAKSGCMLFKENNRPSSPHPFTDVSGAYAPYIKWMYDAGVVSGTTATTFSPDSPIKRQDLCVILYNLYFSRLGIPYTSQRAKVTYSDDSSISSYAKSKVYALQQIYVVSAGGTFRPKENVTRAEAATMIYELWSYAMILSTPQQVQQGNMMCWAACAKVMAEYRKPGSRTQQQIISYMASQYPNRDFDVLGGNITHCAEAADYATDNDIDHVDYYNYWPYNTMIEEVSHYRPFTIAIARWGYDSDVGDYGWIDGHDVVVIGYIKNRNDSQQSNFFIYDVWDNTYHWVTRSELADGNDVYPNDYLNNRMYKGTVYSLE